MLIRFHVSLGTEKFRFNGEFYTGIMYSDHDPILHLDDAATKFSVARFLSNVNTSTVWAISVKCWVSVYIGLTIRIRVDRGLCSEIISSP